MEAAAITRHLGAVADKLEQFPLGLTLNQFSRRMFDRVAPDFCRRWGRGAPRAQTRRTQK